jgi:hypothetical protein
MEDVLPKLDALADAGLEAAGAAADSIRQMEVDLKKACQQVMTFGS